MRIKKNLTHNHMNMKVSYTTFHINYAFMFKEKVKRIIMCERGYHYQ